MFAIPQFNPMTNAPNNAVHGQFSAGVNASGTFVVPDGVYTIWLTMAGGAGSTRESSVPTAGNAGATTSFGAYSANGGGGGPSDNSVGSGGSTSGVGGRSGRLNLSLGFAGGGANLNAGGAGYFVGNPIQVVPGMTFKYSVGAAGSASGADSYVGQDGILIVEW